MKTTYTKNGIKYQVKIATRHPLIEQVKGSEFGLVVNEEKKTIYVCYNTTYRAEKAGFSRSTQ